VALPFHGALHKPPASACTHASLANEAFALVLGAPIQEQQALGSCSFLALSWLLSQRLPHQPGKGLLLQAMVLGHGMQSAWQSATLLVWGIIDSQA